MATNATAERAGIVTAPLSVLTAAPVVTRLRATDGTLCTGGQYDMPDRGWRSGRQNRWEQHQEFQHARSERERPEHWQHERDQDDRDSQHGHRTSERNGCYI